MQKSPLHLLLYLTLGLTSGCSHSEPLSPESISGPTLEVSSLTQHFDSSWNLIEQAPSERMGGPGLVGVLGGTHLKVHASGTYEVILSMVQLTESQIPLTLTLKSTPSHALIGAHLEKRSDSNLALVLRLDGKRNEEIQVEWTSTLLILQNPLTPSDPPTDLYLAPSPCVQSDAPEIAKLAQDLRTPTSTPSDFATSIQTSIRNMKQVSQPRSLDAVGILQSGGNWICTANANLAAALFRNQNIPARTVAVIPVTSQKLEMHRITEFEEDGNWIPFDPSSLQINIPLKPWQNIVISETTLQDEKIAMTPRIGSTLGGPYGHSLEFKKRGLSFTGKNFYWTLAKPLAEFDVREETVKAAFESWIHFTKTGTPQPHWSKTVKASSQEALEQAFTP